ncbi:Wadjet anti-phage system protein JetD domain-containing protein [Flexistipes sinusarabici]|nr:Wadjet anti-phage system protein JetD domain-containing protein [Flexistipes sinusarabici]
MLDRCLLIAKLLENNECSYSKHLDDFINSNILIRKNRQRVIVNDYNYIRNYFNNHCREIYEKYKKLSGLNIYPKNLENLEKAYNLYFYLKKNEPKGIDLRQLSALVFGDSKTIQKSSLLKTLVNEFRPLSAGSFYNIIHIRCDKSIYLEGISITDVMKSNGFFSCFAEKLGLISAEVENTVIFENLSPFFRLNPNNAMFVYVAGFQNIGEICRQLRDHDSGNIIHFGDVDPAGLQIADILMSHIAKTSFFPDINNIEKAINNIHTPVYAEKKFETQSLYSDALREIAEIMTEYEHIRIEQEMIVSLAEKGIINLPVWCRL